MERTVVAVEFPYDARTAAGRDSMRARGASRDAAVRGETAPARAAGVRRSRLVDAALALGVAALGQGGCGPRAAPDPLLPVVEASCDAQVVLLGEASHGDAAAWQLKGELLDRLARDCGFDAVLFESGVYEFVALERALAAGTATEEGLRDAVGALWSGPADADRWLPALFEAARAGRLRLGGIDDQLSSTARFAQTALPDELCAPLPAEEAPACAADLRRHTTWGYDEAHPYGPEALRRLREHLAHVEARLAAPPADDERAALAAALGRALAREDETEHDRAFDARDRSMAETLRWYRRRWPGARLVVWTANVHAARAWPAGSGAPRTPLGAHLARDLEVGLASVATTACGGRVGAAGQPARVLPPPSDGSLEARACAEDGAFVFLGRAALRDLGAIEARPLDHTPRTASWGEVFDGVVVLREERAATPRGR